MRTSLLLALTAAGLLSQAPSPVVINNDQVRVVKAADEPHHRSAPHEHTMNRVMVYLDAGRMKITGASGKAEVSRWKAGEVRWSPARGTHTSENVGDKPFRIVEVELKGTPQPAEYPALDPVKVDPQHYKVEFENDQVRVTRARYGSHEKGVMHEHKLNRVVVYLTDADTTVMEPGGKPSEARHQAGEVVFGGPAKHLEKNLSSRAFEVMVVELKTR
jgi:oxalate decarboxylase/phosphoglucose isomerase-like protein (cupin superfamily)